MKRTNAAGATVGNQFTNGDPVGGIPATVLEQTWLNNVQEELAYIVEQAGITLDGNNTTQVLTALQGLFGGFPYGTTTNVTNAYSVTTTPNYSLTVGKPVLIKFNTANSAAATLNIQSTGNKALVDRNGDPLVANTILANVPYFVAYDGTSHRLISTIQLATSTKPGLVQLADSATMVTGTDASKVPSVATMKNHRLMPKAWCNFLGASGVVNDSVGITSVVRSSAGLYLISYSGTFTNTNYCVVGSFGEASGVGAVFPNMPTTKSTTAMSIAIRNPGNNANVDIGNIQFVAYGDQ